MSNYTKRFNYQFYILLNPDLQHLNEEEAILHYKNYGCNENRKCSILPEVFNYLVYSIIILCIIKEFVRI